jgi:hypothetical protein
MIKILSTDTIIDIISKINHEEGSSITLEFPFGHPVLHNYLSLKIIKNKAGERKITIITSDLTSRKIGKILGIEYSIIKDAKFHAQKSSQKELLSYNFTFIEYFRFQVKKYWEEIKSNFKESGSIKYYSIRYEKQKSRIGFFVFALLFSAFLFVFIFYFAVTKAYITIAPEVKIKTRGKNIVFRETWEESITNGNNIVALKKISKVVNLESRFWSTGIDIKGLKRSSGTITLYNKLPEDVSLREKTRLQNSDGIIYLTTRKVTIPKWTKEVNGSITPWEYTVKIESDYRDINWKMVGENANIGTWVILTLPGLTENRDQIYAKTLVALSGGKEYSWVRITTQEDIENAKKLLIQKLKDLALKELKKQIDEENKLNNVTYDIIGIEDTLFYTWATTQVPSEVVIGKKVENFDLRGSIQIESYIYNQDAVINKLKSVISESVLESSEKVLLIDTKSLRFATILSQQQKPFEIKATMEINAFIIHNFLNDDDSYVQKLKDQIAGLSGEEAEKILLNDPKISNVRIEISPFFLSNITTRKENIIFKVNDKMN